MATYQVPQFITEKSKIVGPFTLKQFIFLVIAAAISFFAYYTFPMFLFVITAALSFGLAFTLALVKINGQDLLSLIKAAISFWQKPKIYVWQRQSRYDVLDVSGMEKVEQIRKNFGLQEKLKNLTLNVTTGGFAPFRQKTKKAPGVRYQVVTFLTGEKEKVRRVDYR